MIHQARTSALQFEKKPLEDAGFLGVVRAFFDHALTPDLRQAGRKTLGVHSDIEACRIWHRRLYERGWIAPAWPVAFGGTGWSARQRFLFDRECARQDAPVLFIGGIRSLGPLLIEQGTSEQRARFLTPMLSGRDLWCHGHGQASLRSSRHHLFGHQRDAAQPYSPSDIDQSLGVRDRSLDLGRLALAWIKYIRQAPLVGLMFDAHIQKR